jgi:hypothetical protein
MSESLQEKLNEYGWFNGSLDSLDKQVILFRWMNLITNDLLRLMQRIEALENKN